MQTEDMEVPIINNLNDNGDRQRPKGKDVFKDQQKESEVNSSTAQRAPTAPGTGAHWTAVCAYVCVCVCCCWEAFRSAECPFHAASQSLLQSMHAGRRRGVILAAAPINNPAVILQRCSAWGTAGGEM